MKNPLGTKFAISTLIFCLSGSNALTEVETKLSCDAYRQFVEKTCPCKNSESDYAISYGEKYCKRFLARSDWSTEGKTWRDSTLQCLQNEITRYVSYQDICNCDELEQFAFQSHAKCYTQHGSSYCKLQEKDLQIIHDILDIPDVLGNLMAWRSAINLSTICIKQEGLGKYIYNTWSGFKNIDFDD